MAPAPRPTNWTGETVAAECGSAHNAYRAAKTSVYRAYFNGNAHRCAKDHEYKVLDLPAARPDDWSGLADRLPVSERHPQHLSGSSSQVLALGLLGVAAKLDPSLG